MTMTFACNLDGSLRLRALSVGGQGSQGGL